MDIIEPAETPVIILESADRAVPAIADFILDNDPVKTATLAIGRTAGLVTSLTWTDPISGNTIKSVAYARTAGLITSIVIRAYDPNGVFVAAQKTDTIVRVAGSVSSITTTRDI